MLEGASQVALVVKNSPANAGDIEDVGSIPGLGRSPGGGHGNPFLPGESPRPEEKRKVYYLPQGGTSFEVGMPFLFLSPPLPSLCSLCTYPKTDTQ